ncbi:ca2+ sensor protein [Sphingomonas sp. NCPPB 2930]|uniref:ca2+ sensor protein n=1 Tax=unclassified Sphingomonas TaxID=196159 RepID=UPI0028675774|nr:ca2+ sensor protein [Sphingomonas sp. SORGH_AS_0870]MDR6147115.1 hypothetical protein [Sphingomonas sp. SORGH_AS_0870]
MRKTLIGLSFAALLGSTAAYAQDDMPPPSPGGMMGVRPDANGNITRAAAIADADRRFADMDADHDGTVTPEEMQAYHARRRAEWQQRRPEGPRPHGERPEGERPGRPAPRPITADAFRARALAMFDRLDTNHDGRIDATERAAAPRFGGRRFGHDRPGDLPPPPQPAPQDH